MVSDNIFHPSLSLNFEMQGLLGGNILIFGDWLPRHIYGRCTALCAIIRMIYISYRLIMMQSTFKLDVVIIDGISVSIPLIQV